MKRALVLALSLGLLAGGCKQKTPNRDYIPVLKKRIYELQEAIKIRTQTALDTLLTDDFRNHGGADSVVHFAYGKDPNFQFAQFGTAEIFYTDQKARADANIIGTNGDTLTPVTLTLERHKDKWLLKSISVRERPKPDTLRVDTAADTTE